jgi:hypothetical protein
MGGYAPKRRSMRAGKAPTRAQAHAEPWMAAPEIAPQRHYHGAMPHTRPGTHTHIHTHSEAHTSYWAIPRVASVSDAPFMHRVVASAMLHTSY